MTPLERWDWSEISAFWVVIVGLFGVFVWVFREIMGRSFVTHREHKLIGDRLIAVEARLGPVETGFAVLNAKMDAATESAHRTERMVSMLVEHQLIAEKAA